MLVLVPSFKGVTLGESQPKESQSWSFPSQSQLLCCVVKLNSLDLHSVTAALSWLRTPGFYFPNPDFWKLYFIQNEFRFLVLGSHHKLVLWVWLCLENGVTSIPKQLLIQLAVIINCSFLCNNDTSNHLFLLQSSLLVLIFILVNKCHPYQNSTTQLGDSQSLLAATKNFLLGVRKSFLKSPFSETVFIENLNFNTEPEEMWFAVSSVVGLFSFLHWHY